MRTRVPSLASLTGLRIQFAEALAVASSCSSDSTPSLGIPYAAGAAIKKMGSRHGAAEMNLTRNSEVRVRALASLIVLSIQHCHELWCRPAAVVLIGPLAWEPPYATGVVLKRKKRKRNNGAALGQGPGFSLKEYT